jgi:uncharacterized membrane protein
MMAGIAYWILSRVIIATEGQDSLLAQAIGKDFKGNISVVIYAVAIPLAFVSQWLAQALYVVVALIWIIPDRRIEKALNSVQH